MKRGNVKSAANVGRRQKENEAETGNPVLHRKSVECHPHRAILKDFGRAESISFKSAKHQKNKK